MPPQVLSNFAAEARKSLIISENQAFHHVSPNLANSADDSPDQTVDRITIEYHLPILTIYHTAPGLECIFAAHRWVIAMDSQTDSGNW